MKRFLFVTSIAAFALSACGSFRAAQPHLPAPTEAPAYYGGAPAMGGGGAGEGLAPLDAAKDINAQQSLALAYARTREAGTAASQRLVIQNADLSIVVADVEARAKAIQQMAEQMGGHVVSVNIYKTYAANGNQVPEAQVVVRVPSDKLDEALDQIKKDTVDVQNETRSGQDVTDQYVDLQSRLKAKQAAEAQLLKIMENAEKTEDVLAVYTQLQSVQSDIEVLKGQIKYYEESAALSAITVRVVAQETIKPLEIGPWKPGGVALKAIQNLIDFWKGFVEFLIRFFLYTLPVLITIGIPLYLVFLGVRAVYRKVRRDKKPVAAPPAEKKK